MLLVLTTVNVAAATNAAGTVNAAAAAAATNAAATNAAPDWEHYDRVHVRGKQNN